MTAPRRFGPVQLATYLGLEQWQLERAVSDGLIPGPDRSRGRWSAPIADAALAGIGGHPRGGRVDPGPRRGPRRRRAVPAARPGGDRRRG